MLSNSGKFKDRNPDVTAAGKCFTLGETAKECLNIPRKPLTPEPVHKFRCTTNPAPAERRIFYGRYSDPNIASLLSHGIDTKPSLKARDLILPRPKSLYVQRLCDKKEDLYATRKKAPLGKSHDQRVGLPKGVEPYDVRYGIKVFRDCTAGELVNPAKSKNEVEVESTQGSDLYIKSHSAYSVGETYDRKYNWSRIPKTSCFGKETPHDNRGRNVQKTLKWLHETQSAKAAHVVSERVDNFRERTQPQVGTVHDPIKETMLARVPSDHTFGVLVKPDEYGAGDLIHNRAAGRFLRGKDKERGVLAAIRQHLKKANYHNFHDLNAAFKFYDKDSSGKIDINELREICIQFNLPIDKELLEALFDYCDIDKDGQIDYIEFSNFLNWKGKMPTRIKNKDSADDSDTKSEDEAPEELHKQIDDAVVDFKTSSQTINAVVGGVKTGDWKFNGIPTIRSDLPAPRIRRIGDSTNYGDESNAYGLINPSIYSNHGVFERDFFQNRDENEIRQIFDSIGFALTNDDFQKVWETARENSDNGKVSVETFRQILYGSIVNKDEQDIAEAGQDNVTTVVSERPEIYRNIDLKYSKKESELKDGFKEAEYVMAQ
ncbi:EF-hand domain-containing family member B-like [Rhopilema esculentum]|uniref:EF-hand domain-containing family member B-like n=1 Tax=Rhopilema esculentum TaxID=499914 RepID=UPI0031D23E5F